MCLAVPGKIISIEDHTNPLLRAGKVSFGGIVKSVNLAYVPDVQIEDYVIVHAGFAISILDQQEAQQTLADIQKMQTL